MKLQQYILGGMAIFLTVFLPQSLSAQKDHHRQFTQESPLVYEDVWDLCPFAFLNEQGEPDGYNIDLLKIIFKKLDIPYVVKLKPTDEVMKDLESGAADLTLTTKMGSTVHHDWFGKNTIQLFTNNVLCAKGQEVPIHTFEDLGKHKVMVHLNSSCYRMMKEKGWEKNAIPYYDMIEAVQKVYTEGKGMVVWNETSLKWLLHMYQLEGMQMVAIDMPQGEYHFYANNKELLNEIDKVYDELQKDGMLKSIQDKWFNPDKEGAANWTWIWYPVGIAAFILIGLLFLNYYYRSLERKMTSLGLIRNKHLALVLKTSHVSIWTYDVATQTFTMMDKNGQPERELSSMEFTHQFHHEDFERIYEGIQQITSLEKERIRLQLKAYADNSKELRDYIITIGILRRTQGKPSVLIGTKSDITEEAAKMKSAKEKLMRYQSVFNNAMVDMTYFDADGNLIDINERACHTFNVSKKMLIEDAHITLADIIDDPTFNPKHVEYYHATQFISPELNIRKAKYITNPIFFDIQVVPYYDQEGKLLGTYTTGRDVTEIANAYHQLQKGIANIQKATVEVTEYVNNINYVLGVGGIRMAEYSPSTHTLTIFKGLNQVQLSLTQSRCMTLIDEQSRKKAMRLLNSMDNQTFNSIDAEIKTNLHIKGRTLYVQFHFIPVYDDKGRLDRYFGMCKDLSEIKATELLLEKETIRAKDVENLKNSFLRNMSYEIRTPLNSVVGFAELFEMDHSQEDEDIFIQEIKTSSAHLLNLINDILFLSRLDAHMIEINKQPTDFAQTFEGHCQFGWSKHIKPGVEYLVENPYEQLVVDIDDSNMGRIIEQITMNAAQHTESGTVRARYDYISGKLMIAIDDTGKGMSESTLSRIYERFTSGPNSGTGLGLPICKELVEQMGGSIDISSELSKGTTVWITMPCKASVILRKKKNKKE